MKLIGARSWAIAEGYIPPSSTGDKPELRSHETVCVLNAGGVDAAVKVTVFFEDREPAGPYRFVVPARRTRHVLFNHLSNPEVLPVGIAFASLIESDVPVVVQHSRLDSRQPALALLSTIAFPGLN